jgi:hypothetical protein
MFDTRSDQERATTPPPPVKPRYKLTCPGHIWGEWMRVIGGSCRDYRRFCKGSVEQ